MADNVLWVLQRECQRGKVLFFAHDNHVRADLEALGPPSWPSRVRPAGGYLRSALGPDLVVIGAYFGRGSGFPAERVPLPPDTTGMDSLLCSLSIPRFIMDLRELPNAGILHEWFQAAHETRSSNFGEEALMVAPLGAYDAILFIDTITPTPAQPRR